MSFMQSTQRQIYKAKSKYHFFKFMKNPEDTEGIFDMTSSFQQAAEPEVLSRLMSKFLENPQLKRAYDEKYWPQVPTLEELKVYPEGSYGREASEFFLRWSLDPGLFPAPNFSSPQEYFTSRLYQAHDFWHVLTGYDISLEDELALQAFGVAQYQQPISLAIIAGGLIHLLQKTPERSAEMLAAICQGYDRGLKAKNFLIVPLLERLADPLSEVRRDLGLE